jgi:hypothetical protein
MTQAVAKNSLVFAFLFFSASLLGVADEVASATISIATSSSPETLTPSASAVTLKIKGVLPS